MIEQITYLRFMRRLDDLQTTAEQKAQFTGTGVIDNPVFLPGQQHLRWSRFKALDDAQEMYDVVSDEVFPFLRTLGGDDSTYSHHMANARFTIPTPQLLDRVVQLVDVRSTACGTGRSMRPTAGPAVSTPRASWKGWSSGVVVADLCPP